MILKNLLRAAVACAALTLVGALSRVPYDADNSKKALLRLSWRTGGEPAESCRDRTQEELEALPVHMREPQICTARSASYRLEVRIDEEPVVVRELKGSGARADRPVYVLWQDTLSPGTHRVAIQFYSTHDKTGDRTRLEETLDVRQGEIVLVTHSGASGSLQVRRARQVQQGP